MKLNEMNLELIEKNVKVLKQVKENPNLIVEFSFIGKNEWLARTGNWENCYLYDYEYRIKPEPKYQPYKEVKIEWIQKRIVYKGERFNIQGIGDSIIYFDNQWWLLEKILADTIWGNNGDENDGKPFGEVVE
jgi:hypothetical protein